MSFYLKTALSHLFKSLKTNVIVSHLQCRQPPGGGGTSRSCCRWQEAELWRSSRGREEGEGAGGSRQPPDRREERTRGLAWTACTSRLNVPTGAVTGEGGLLQGPGSSSDVAADRGDTEEALEAPGASFSLCPPPPSSHSSEVIFASWLCLQRSLSFTFESGAEGLRRSFVLSLTAAPPDPEHLQPPTGRPSAGPTCAALAATDAPACPTSADCTSCTCWVWRGGASDPSGVWRKARIIERWSSPFDRFTHYCRLTWELAAGSSGNRWCSSHTGSVFAAALEQQRWSPRWPSPGGDCSSDWEKTCSGQTGQEAQPFSHFNKRRGANSWPFAVQVVRPHSHAAGGHFKDAALQDGRPEHEEDDMKEY